MFYKDFGFLMVGPALCTGKDPLRATILADGVEG